MMRFQIGVHIRKVNFMSVYCNWINGNVSADKLSKYCKPFFSMKGEDCVCMRCELSPQIALGMPIDRLLEQLRSGDV
jgi:hypothetical protein